MKRRKLFRLTLTAVFIAVTCALTWVIRIPTPSRGYINLGDCAVIIGAFVLGPVYGAIAGGIGSALADLLGGYPQYIPATLIIKAAMAVTAAAVIKLFSKKGIRLSGAAVLAGGVAAAVLMVSGYFLYESLIYDGIAAAIPGIPGNAVQGVAGAVGAYFISKVLTRSGIVKKIQTQQVKKPDDDTENGGEGAD